MPLLHTGSVIDIENGGTGGVTAAEARDNLGITSLLVYPKPHDISSQVDGIVSTFFLPTPAIIDSVQIFADGLLMREGAGNDYLQVDDSTITFNFTPVLETSIIAIYVETLS